MAYFLNSEDGIQFQNNHCSKCIHEGEENTCMLFSLHFFLQDDWKKDPEHPMNQLISEEVFDGHLKRTCTMYSKAPEEIPPLMRSVEPLTEAQIKELLG